MKRQSKRTATAILAGLMAAVFLGGCGGGGGGSSAGGAANVSKGNFQVRVDMSRLAGAIPAGTDVSADIAAISHDTTGNPTLLSNKVVALTLDPADGKYKGLASLSYITPGKNFLCRVKILSNGQEFAYMGAIVDNLTDETVTVVGINATSTVKAQATLFYAIATTAWMSDETVVTPALKDAIDAAVANLSAAGTINTDDYILKSKTAADPFLPQNWNFAHTKKLQRVIDALGTADKIPPRIVDYTPKNGDNNVPSNMPRMTIVFSETMNSAINMNDPATLAASGFTATIERPADGSRFVLDSSTALYYGSFSWSATNTASDTLIFAFKANNRLGQSGLAWLAPNTPYDIVNRVISNYLTDLAGNRLDTRAGFPSTDFPSSGSFRTGPCLAGDTTCNI